jgi:hypothetical protein
MAISRMNMERQMRNMGGIMGLEDQRQGYFLGKLVKKITKPIKKIVKSPIGKAALLAAAGYGLGAIGPGGFSKARMISRLASPFGSFAGGPGASESFMGLGRFTPSKLGKALFYKDGTFNLGKAALTGLGATAIAAPFFMGGEEEVDEGTPFTMAQPDIEDIRSQAKAYYSDPTNSALYFMPPKAAVQRSFYAADGGLASLRPGYRIGGGVLQKAGQMIKSGVGKVKSLFDDADINVSIRDEDVMTDGGLQAQAVGQDVFITPKSRKAVKVMDDLIEEGYDITKAEDGSYSINALDEGALDIVTQRLRIGDKGADEFIDAQDYYFKGDTGMMDEESKMIYNALRDRKAEGGLMDLGGLEKDYREGGFVPLGAEERADDVPARLSKNEFVFTADAVRNAGEGDIDKGAEVMQNMMDNLEAGGTISEESQGKENPAQEMFNQAQMLESRIA